KSFGAAVALAHRPSPGFMCVTFSTNATSAASGTADGLCAATAATYDFPRLMRHARSQAARPCATALPAAVEIDTVKRTARALVARDRIVIPLSAFELRIDLSAGAHRPMDFLPPCFRAPGQYRIALALPRRDLREQLAVAREALRGKLTARDGAEHGAARLVLVRAVAEAAAPGERRDVREARLDTAGVVEQAELAQARCVDEHAAAR